MDVLEVTFLDLVEQLVLALGSKRVVSLEHHIEEDAKRPHVSINRTVIDF